MENFIITSSNFLKKYRIKFNLTQDELAKKLNVSLSAVEKWERKKNAIPVEVLITIQKGLGISLDEICGIENAKTHVKNESPELWKNEYEKDNSITYEYEIEHSVTSTDYLKHIQLKEMLFFLDGSNLPIYLDENEIVLVNEPSIEKNIICFFIRKGFMSYKKTIDYATRTASFRITVAPILAKALINLHIEYLSEMIKTPEQIEEVVKICIRKEKARNDCAFQNESTMKTIAEMKELLSKIEKFETV